MGILDQAVIPIKKNTMKQFIKKLLGIKDAELIKKEDPIKFSPKEIATANKEPWVAVLDTHVNKDNIRNGFFELDWNEYFVLQLRANGYKGDTEEAVVDAWFGELCRNVGNDSGVNMNQRTAGFIDVQNLGNGRKEIS